MIFFSNHRPQKTHYLENSNREPGKLVVDWNLVLPFELIERSWDEVLRQKSPFFILKTNWRYSSDLNTAEIIRKPYGDQFVYQFIQHIISGSC